VCMVLVCTPLLMLENTPKESLASLKDLQVMFCWLAQGTDSKCILNGGYKVTCEIFVNLQSKIRAAPLVWVRAYHAQWTTSCQNCKFEIPAIRSINAEL